MRDKEQEFQQKIRVTRKLRWQRHQKPCIMHLCEVLQCYNPVATGKKLSIACSIKVFLNTGRDLIQGSYLNTGQDLRCDIS